MEKCFKCLNCNTSSGAIASFAAPIHQLYWKRVVCTECIQEWYICTLHVLKRWKINEFYMAHLHFINAEHECNIPQITAAEKSTISTQTAFINHNISTQHTNNSSSTVTNKRTSPNYSPCTSPHNDSIPHTEYEIDNEQIIRSEDKLSGNKRKADSLVSISEFSHLSMSKHSTRFFFNEYEREGSGINKILACEFSNLDACSVSSNEAEAHFHLLLVSLLQTLTGPQRQAVVTMLKFWQTHPSSFQNSRLSTTMSDINKIYISGANSITSNIPHPTVFDKDDHACVSLKDVLAHQLAHGMDLDNITYNRSNLNVICMIWIASMYMDGFVNDFLSCIFLLYSQNTEICLCHANIPFTFENIKKTI